MPQDFFYGENNAVLQALLNAGLSQKGCKTIQSNPDAAKAMVASLQPFLCPINPYPERHYDLSAILGLAEPLPNIVWPNKELTKNQYLVAERGEAPSEFLSNMPNEEILIWKKLRKFPWWTKRIKPGIYLVTLPLPNSDGITKAEKERLCRTNGGEMTPFTLNAKLRLAHKRETGKEVGGFTICPELTRFNRSAGLCWEDAQLHCSEWGVEAGDILCTSSSEWLSPLEH